MFKIFIAIIGVAVIGALSFSFGMLFAAMGWGLPCDSNCSGFTWFKYLTGYWFAAVDGARGEDALADDVLELMANTFVFFSVPWLLFIFKRRRRRVMDPHRLPLVD